MFMHGHLNKCVIDESKSRTQLGGYRMVSTDICVDNSMVLICATLKAKDDENLFMRLYFIYILSKAKYQFRSCLLSNYMWISTTEF